jgi:hypothetical protein
LAQHTTVFSLAARTATTTSRDFKNDGGQGAIVTIDVTAATASPSVVFSIERKDPTSGKYATILDSAAITGTGTTVLRIHPELTAAANTVAKDMMPAIWRVKATHADGDSITYSVGASLV